MCEEPATGWLSLDCGLKQKTRQIHYRYRSFEAFTERFLLPASVSAADVGPNVRTPV